MVLSITKNVFNISNILKLFLLVNLILINSPSINCSLYFRSEKEKTINLKFLNEYLNQKDKSNLDFQMTNEEYTFSAKEELNPKEPGIKVNADYVVCGCNILY